jgi:hypothetical protein
MLQSQEIAFFRSPCLRYRVFKFVPGVRNRTQCTLRNQEGFQFRVFFLAHIRKAHVRNRACGSSRPGA